MSELTVFSNDGLIDESLWSTFGVSIKETDSPIGKFGTGLKYAIAVLLRENRRIERKSGDNHYVFSTHKKLYRGKEYDQVLCNGKEMPFTTHLGSGWELWQAYREIYSNCLDEGGGIGDGGETQVTADFSGVDLNDVVIDTDATPIASSDYCDVYAGESAALFYRGMKAAKLTTTSFFTYNIKRAYLTEDRTFKYSFQTDSAILNTVMRSDNKNFVEQFMFQSQDYYEKGVDYMPVGIKCSSQIKKLYDQFRKDNVYIHPAIAKAARSEMGAAVYEPIKPTARQSAIIKKAVEFLEKMDCTVSYPIFVSCSLGRSTLAVADMVGERILLSDRVLDMGLKQVVSTLFEENLHLDKKLSDCTYEMQSHLFDLIITMGEKLTGEII